MKNAKLFLALISLTLSGCATLSPTTPKDPWAGMPKDQLLNTIGLPNLSTHTSTGEILQYENCRQINIGVPGPFGVNVGGNRLLCDVFLFTIENGKVLKSQQFQRG